MTALIFGISGQDGFYLDAILKGQGISVIGVSRNTGDWIKGDVSDFESVETLIKDHMPAYVFHLAANSTTKHDVVFENHETISTGTLNVLEAVFRHVPRCKVFISGSALQFKNINEPISEEDPFDARDPYSVARIHSVYAARYYRRLGIKTYVGYFFHHDSLRRSERHMNMKIAKAALRIKNGSNEAIEIGNIDVVKEYNYAGDVAEAIWLLTRQDNVYETVVGSGKGYAIKDWLEICFNLIGKEWTRFVKVRNDYQPEFMRLVSNPRTLFALGYKPSTDIYQLAEKMMNEEV